MTETPRVLAVDERGTARLAGDDHEVDRLVARSLARPTEGGRS